MQALQYLFIGSGIFAIISLLWLLNTLSVFDCLKSSPVKSSAHCLNLLIAQYDSIIRNIAKSSQPRARARQSVLREIPAVNLSQAPSSTALIPYTGV